jgi:hypothetical protein
MKTIARMTAFFFALALAAVAQQPSASMAEQHSGGMMPQHAHAATAALSYAELKQTVAQLDRAREATAKYQDVHMAEADGYRPIGGDHPKMGIHYVRTLEPREFDLEKPPILVYEKTASGGYSLVAVAYLLNAAEGPDGRPLNSPFPTSLAQWHRHTNICMLPGLANPGGLTESQCREKGGKFIAEAPWMVHVWIWKDNPSGVFNEQNPAVQ